MVDGWPFVRRTPENPGSTPDSGPHEAPVLEWKHDAEARIFGTPLVADGRVYVGTCAQSHWDDTGCVVAIDQSTGQRAWMAADEALEVRGTPGFADGKLYVGDLDDRRYTIDATDGETLHLDEEHGLTPPDGVYPLVSDGTVFTTPYRLEARDTESWTLRWALEDREDMSVAEPPALADDTLLTACEPATGERVYVGQDDDGYPLFVREIEPSLRALDATTGALRWKRSLPGRARSPAIADGVAYLATWGSDPQGARVTAVSVGSDDQQVPDEEPVDYHEFGTVHAIDVETGGEYWSHRLDSPVKTMPTVYQETICVGTLAGTVVALDVATGKRRWETRVNEEGSVLSWPTIAADTVYVGSRDEALYALDRHDGSVRWRFETELGVDSNPSVVDETVYVGDNGGNVYAIGEE